MATFATVSIEAIAPKAKAGPGPRTLVAQEYREALKQRLDAHEALVVELDEGDKLLTVRNRILSAARALGVHDKVKIAKRRGQNAVAAWHLDHEAEVAAAAYAVEDADATVVEDANATVEDADSSS